MKTRIIILIGILFPVLSFASTSYSSSLLSSDSNQYVALQAEKVIEWKIELTPRSIDADDVVEREEVMRVEKWMLNVNDTQWHDEEVEEELRKEEWMLNPGSDSWKPIIDEKEIEMEDWMCNPSSWLHAF